jgi:vancomycin permeability regulator SanA
MEGEGLSPDESFDQMVKVSQHTNTKLREIAARVVEATERRVPSEEPSLTGGFHSIRRLSSIRAYR